ncbi:MAG: CTP synthase [Candidatus Woesearchaeota archaeon]
MHQTKYVVVTGGVISGLGKGICAASIASLLQAQGLAVSVVKIDPYINLDAGTMRPTEHGEVFVTDDGGETDQDLGNYERFLDKSFTKLHNITTGQVYESVIHRERNLEYNGKCVEVIPHIPLEVQSRIKELASKDKADVMMIEVGGTIGDYQSVLFLEAMREMKRESNNMVFVHVVYLPIPSNIGEMKTKPAQHSVRDLMASGIQPDFIVGRSEKPIDEIRKDKLALFCNVKKADIVSSPDVDSIYRVPLVFEAQGFTKNLLAKLGLPYKPNKLGIWPNLSHKIADAKEIVKIGIVGKYFDIGDFVLEDSYISVIESIRHACFSCGAKPQICWIDSKALESGTSSLSGFDAIIVPGGFGSSGVEGKINAIRFCREQKIPFLGLCYGLQLAVVEFARNVCGLKDAHTTEINPKTKHPVVAILPDQVKHIQSSNYGGTMRLGAFPAKLKKGSLVHSLYKSDLVSERHRHRYEVNPDYVVALEKQGLVFSGTSPDHRLMEFLELPNHPFFVATQAHPEFKSRPMRPSPCFFGLIKAALARKT